MKVKLTKDYFVKNIGGNFDEDTASILFNYFEKTEKNVSEPIEIDMYDVRKYFKVVPNIEVEPILIKNDYLSSKDKNDSKSVDKAISSAKKDNFIAYENNKYTIFYYG